MTLPSEQPLPQVQNKPYSADLFQSLRLKYLAMTYSRQDLLYKVLYDKIYRHHLYSVASDVDLYKQPKTAMPRQQVREQLLTDFQSHELRPTARDFSELKYVEDMTTSSYLLDQKWPLALSILGCLVLSRRLVHMNATSTKQSIYIMQNTAGKKQHNILHLSKLVLYVFNLCTLFSTTVLTGI